MSLHTILGPGIYNVHQTYLYGNTHCGFPEGLNKNTIKIQVKHFVNDQHEMYDIVYALDVLC